MKPQVLRSLHRHWTWADRQRELFLNYLRQDFPSMPVAAIGSPSFFVSSMVTAMCLWYALLYVTCDGLSRFGGVMVEEIAPDYAKVKANLEAFRHAIFHVQPRYWSHGLRNLLTDAAAADQIGTVHRGVGAWLQQRVEELDGSMPGDA
jgi:hypothetical protein